MAADPKALLAEHVGDRVRQLRDKAKLSQEEVAFMASIARQSLVEIERGRVTPNADTLVRIAWALGARVEELLPQDYTPFVETGSFRRFRELLEKRSNARNGAKRAKKVPQQGRKTSDRTGREGGFPTTEPRPAATAAEAA